jgi:PhoD-like phosphatase
VSVAGMNLAGSGVPIGHVAGERPSFMLPSKRDKLAFVHASCRKPHGGGPDMLPLVDTLVGASRLATEGPRVRPQQLFLTGDQIYADDVAPGLLGALMEAGELLLGWSTPEQLPIGSGHQGWLAPGWRSLLLDVYDIRPRTAYSDNHLLGFGEWCAMYVMAWSDAIWRRDGKGDCTLPSPVDLAGARVFGSHDSATLEAIEFARRLPFVRRALANAATYMMFDDHEITDDWFVNAEVDARLRTGLGKQMVRNGLLAYAVFQDWGNQPSDYRAGKHGDTLLRLLTCPKAGSPPIATPTAIDPVSKRAVSALLDEVLDLAAARAPTANHAKRKRWDYVIDGDDHRVVALDCRTFRELPTNLLGGEFNAGLIEPAAQALQIDPHLATLGERELFLISPAPVIGMWIVEVLQKLMIAKHPDIGTEEFDNEPWAGNAACFRALLDRLAPHQPVVFLSGDVHYAFTQDVKRCKAGASTRFVQLCSSSTKNSEAKTALLSIIELITGPLLAGNLSLTADELRRFVLEQGEDLEARAYETIAAGLHDMFNDVPDPILHGERALYQGKDALAELAKDLLLLGFSPGAWAGLELYENLQLGAVEADQAVQLLEQGQQFLDNAGLTASSTAMYVKIVVDESPGPNSVPPLARTDEQRDDHGAMLRGQLAQLSPAARLGVLRRNRGSIGDSNIGLVSFEKRGSSWDLLHDLYWSHLRTPLAIFATMPALPMFTRHRVPMTAADPCPTPGSSKGSTKAGGTP